jgi:hypothetical protein
MSHFSRVKTGFPDRRDTDFDGLDDHPDGLIPSRKASSPLLNERCTPLKFTNPLVADSFGCQLNGLNEFDSWFKVTGYMYEEMRTNATSARSKRMALEYNTPAAYLEFGVLVAPCMGWDHKPMIWDLLPGPVVNGEKQTFFKVGEF